ncbi:hypothetical protein [Bradyrhizobium sp. Leo121]|uniref:hypothetical protein n=1 Tax=Bradyrhizobium sp. Leo121 TaxID=1571195 RepID=UPI001029385B|nr:hypothetical protein [Bradyrhizobium sp. Leo121]
MSELEHARQHAHDHHYACANLFGCGDEKGMGIIREDIKDAAFDNRASDRLLHMDHVDQETFGGYLSARGRWRRKFLQASSFLGVLAAVEPWFTGLAQSQESGARPVRRSQPDGRVHVIPGKRFGSGYSTPPCHPFSPSSRATSSASPILGRTS